MNDVNSTAERGRRRATLDLIARGAVAVVLPGELGRVHFGQMDAVPVLGDVLGLRRAIANVIENAAKYSDDVVEIDAYETDQGAAIRVRDHGRGIHPDDLASITHEGHRGRLADEGDGGRGIGLASVQQIVSAHGGTLRIQSTLGEGTTVVISIPRVLRRGRRLTRTLRPSRRSVIRAARADTGAAARRGSTAPLRPRTW